MNILDTNFNGGMPLELDDLRWMQDASKDAIAKLISFLGDNFYITLPPLSGIGTTNFNYGAGIMVLNGEVCEIFGSGSSSPIDNVALPYLYWEIGNKAELAGIETFENGTPHATYITRYARIAGYATPQNGVSIWLQTAKQLINELTIDTVHEYTVRQSWRQADQQGIAVAGSSVINVNTNKGNIYWYNIDNATVPLDRFSLAFPNGTWMGLLFTGGSNFAVKIKDGNAFANGIVTHNKTVRFEYLQIAFFIWVEGKAVLVNAPPNALQADNNKAIRTKIIEIGDWNMNVDAVAIVNHNIPDYKKIRSYSVVIRDDTDGFYMPLEARNPNTGILYGGIGLIGSTQLTLSRTNGGDFDNSSYSLTGYNRGWITITYED